MKQIDDRAGIAVLTFAALAWVALGAVFVPIMLTEVITRALNDVYMGAGKGILARLMAAKT